MNDKTRQIAIRFMRKVEQTVWNSTENLVLNEHLSVGFNSMANRLCFIFYVLDVFMLNMKGWAINDEES